MNRTERLTRSIEENPHLSDLSKAKLTLVLSSLEDDDTSTAALAVYGKINAERVKTSHPDELLTNLEARVLHTLIGPMASLLERDPYRSNPSLVLLMATIVGVLTGQDMARQGFALGEELTDQKDA